MIIPLFDLLDQKTNGGLGDDGLILADVCEAGSSGGEVVFVHATDR